MIAQFFNNTAPNNKVDKSSNIVQVGEDTELTLYLPTSTSNPVFKVHNSAISNTVNYLKADGTLGNRYYFINDVVHDKGFKLIYCTVDVLMSYKDEIKAMNCNIVRQENATAEQGAGKYVDSYYTTYAQKQNIIDTIGTLWGDLGSGSACYLVGTT